MPMMDSKIYGFQAWAILPVYGTSREQGKDSVHMLLDCDALDYICEVLHV